VTVDLRYGLFGLSHAMPANIESPVPVTTGVKCQTRMCSESSIAQPRRVATNANESTRPVDANVDPIIALHQLHLLFLFGRRKGPPFRAIRKGDRLAENPITRIDGFPDDYASCFARRPPYSACCHAFRATGITPWPRLVKLMYKTWP
jgi:hypothetical protein